MKKLRHKQFVALLQVFKTAFDDDLALIHQRDARGNRLGAYHVVRHDD